MPPIVTATEVICFQDIDYDRLKKNPECSRRHFLFIFIFIFIIIFKEYSIPILLSIAAQYLLAAPNFCWPWFFQRTFLYS